MQLIGWKNVVAAIEKGQKDGELLASVDLPKWAKNIDAVHNTEGSYSPAAAKYIGLRDKPVYERQARRENVIGSDMPHIRKMGTTIFENDSARMWDSGDGVAVLSVDTKMGACGTEVLQSIIQACEESERSHGALVLWRGEAPFSFGANLKEAMGFVEAGQVDKVKSMIADFQLASMALKHCHVPTVAAVEGMALGGGCEIQMHANKTVAAQETYTGLVEAGVGLLPAGAGSKELALRAAKKAGTGDLVPHLSKAFQNMAMAKVSASALDAIDMGLMSPNDLVIANSHELLHVARHQAIGLLNSEYRPPSKDEKIRVAGKPGHATLMTMAINMQEGNYISEHDYFIADRIAHVITGGDVDQDTIVPQDWLLKLERDCFFELMQTEKTQARILHTMTTGKPLRN